MDLARDMERMHITKHDLRRILAALKRRWRKNPVANAAYITAATGVQAALLLTPDHVVQKFWTDFLKAVKYLMELNAHRDPDSDFDVSFFYTKLDEAIESGELFGDEDD